MSDSATLRASQARREKLRTMIRLAEARWYEAYRAGTKQLMQEIDAEIRQLNLALYDI